MKRKYIHVGQFFTIPQNGTAVVCYISIISVGNIGYCIKASRNMFISIMTC